MYDLIIKNGEVIDVAGGHVGRFDVAITRDRIAAIEPDLSKSASHATIDAAGHIVTPGLVDLHTHVYHKVTYWGINPDPIAARSGVTTWLDVGSAGAYNFLGFRDWVIKLAESRIYALLNISGVGLTMPNWDFLNLNAVDVDLCCKLINDHRDLILGVKARVDVGTSAGNLEGLRRARAASDRVQLPLMVHIADGPPHIDEIMPFLKPGDILTHCCTGRNNKLATDAGRIIAVATAARERGVIFDVGHGAGSFSWDSAERMLAAGFVPDVISTDVHQLAANGPCFDMPTTLSKFLHLGLSLQDTIARASAVPARVMGMDDIGTLRVGARADVGIFKLHEGNFPLYDVYMKVYNAKHLLVNTLTILNGRPMRRRLDDPMMPWITLSDDQKALRERGHTPERMVG